MADDASDPAPRGPLKIERLYAFISSDGDGDEGLVAVSSPWGLMPAVGADFARVDQLRAIVQDISNHLGRPISLRFFESMREIETIYPDLPPQGDKPS